MLSFHVRCGKGIVRSNGGSEMNDRDHVRNAPIHKVDTRGERRLLGRRCVRQGNEAAAVLQLRDARGLKRPLGGGNLQVRGAMIGMPRSIVDQRQRVRSGGANLPKTRTAAHR